MGKIAFTFEAETLPDRIFEGVIATNDAGQYTRDGVVLLDPAGDEGVFVVTEDGGQFFGQRGSVAWSVED